MQRVVVIDYGMSNLRSVAKALEIAGAGDVEVCISGDPALIAGADRLVFPGQGAIGECMRHLRALGLDGVIRQAVGEKPFLGICLGLQSLFDWSEESGGMAGLGVFPGRVVRFPEPCINAAGERLKVPHMGWNVVHPVGRRHALLKGLAEAERFYFVHSYFVVPSDPGLVLATTSHGEDFCAAAGKAWVFATQFHPEKSQRAGLQVLANFLSWDGAGA